MSVEQTVKINSFHLDQFHSARFWIGGNDIAQTGTYIWEGTQRDTLITTKGPPIMVETIWKNTAWKCQIAITMNGMIMNVKASSILFVK